ncbi:hypothetical protein [Nostoc sp.]
MVHCIFYRPLLQNPELQLIPWLVEDQPSMGLLKAVLINDTDATP